jgi:cobalamin biosynthesis protein CobT
MRRFLFEADDDNETSGGNTNNNNDQAANDTAADNNNDSGNEDNADDANDNQEDQNTDENQDDNQEDDNQNDENQDEDNNDEDENYDINDDDENQDDENQDENSDDTTDDSSDETADSKADALKAKDREVFDSLSIAEQQIKIKELKNQFADLYNNCSSIIERLNDVALELIDEYPQLKKISSVLYELKDMISFYILNIYDTKSFFENDIVFNRYLLILNGIKGVLTTIKNDKNSDK